MKHTHSYFDSFLDNEHRLIHLAGETSNQETPPPTEGQRVEMEAQQHEETETLETPEDAARKGDEALVDAEKGSNDLQADVKKAQDDVSRIRLAAALGSGGLSAEEEHSAAEQRLAEAQTNALMEDHNPMSGGTVNETHESQPDTMNEVEAVAVNVDESSDHVEEQKTNETTSEYMEKMKTVVSKLQEMLAYMKQNHVGEEDATVYSMMNGINNDLMDAGETPEGAQSKAEIVNNQPNRLVAMNDQQSILVQYAENQDAITFSRIESAKPGKRWTVDIATNRDTESPEPGKGGGGDGAGGIPVETPTKSEGGTPAEGSTPQEQQEDPVANLDKAKNATDSAWQKFMEARDGYFKSQAGAKEGAENSAKEAIDGLLQSVETEEALMREVGDGKGGEQDASRWHEINGRREQALALQSQLKEADEAENPATADKKGEEEPLTEESVKGQFKEAIKLMGSKDAAERNKGVGLLIETLIKYIELKLTGGDKGAKKNPETQEGKSNTETPESEEKESSATSPEQKETPESSDQREVLHGPARRARLINAYRAEQQKQPGITATEFIAIKEDAIQKDETRFAEEQTDLQKEEKNAQEKLDILKSKREKASPKERDQMEADIKAAEDVVRDIGEKIRKNQDGIKKIEDRKNDIIILKELRDSIAELKKQLDELPKETLENLSKEQRDVLEAFIEGTDAETYRIGFPTDKQIEKLPQNIQKILKESSFYRQKGLYREGSTNFNMQGPEPYRMGTTPSENLNRRILEKDPPSSASIPTQVRNQVQGIRNQVKEVRKTVRSWRNNIRKWIGK